MTQRDTPNKHSLKYTLQYQSFRKLSGCFPKMQKTSPPRGISAIRKPSKSFQETVRRFSEGS